MAIQLLQQALDEEPERWATQVPEREFPNQVVQRDAISKERFLQDVRDYIVPFGDPEGRENIGGTDILSTLHLVSAEIQAHPEHRTTFVLFSDMLQANRVMNLEGLTRMPADNWVRTEGSQGDSPRSDRTLCACRGGSEGHANLAGRKGVLDGVLRSDRRHPVRPKLYLPSGPDSREALSYDHLSGTDCRVREVPGLLGRPTTHLRRSPDLRLLPWTALSEGSWCDWEAGAGPARATGCRSPRACPLPRR